MPDDATPPTADALRHAMLQRWPLIAVVAVAVTLAAWLAATLQPKRYRTSAIAAVTPIADQLTPSDIIRGVDTLERRVVIASLAALASAPVIQRQVLTGTDATIEAIVLPNTNLFRIEVDGSEPEAIAAIANRVPPLLSAQAKTMYRLYGVTLVSSAAKPDAPYLPRIGRAVITGLLLGLLAGTAIAYMIERRRAPRA